MALLSKFKNKQKKPVEKPAVSKTASRPRPQAYRIVQRPHITEKATLLAEKGKYVFRVSRSANKPEIKKAIESLYEVKVNRVHLIHVAAKQRRLGRSQGWQGGLKKGFKKAIVSLAPGEKIELLPK